MYISYLGDIRKQGTEAPCKRRLFFEGEYYCITRAHTNSGPKEKKLLTLDICTICKAELWKLPQTTQTQTETAVLAPVQDAQQVSNATKPYNPQRSYCQNQGRYVYLWECQKCRNPCTNKNPQ